VDVYIEKVVEVAVGFGLDVEEEVGG